MAPSAKFFPLLPEPGRCGPPNPSAVSRRSAVWAPATAAHVAEAVRRRGAPRSTGSPAATAAGCAATRGPRAVWPAVGRLARSTVGRPLACPAVAPSAPRGSGDTTRVADRARSTECRTGSTAGSPDQPSAGDDTGRGMRPAEKRGNPTQRRRRYGPRDAARATPTVAYGYPQFPQVYPQLTDGYYPIDPASTGCPGS